MIDESCCEQMALWNKNGAKGALRLQGTVFRNEEQNVQTQLGMPFYEAPGSTGSLLLSL